VACAVLSVRYDLAAPVTEEFGSASGSGLAGLVLTIPGALLLWRLGPHPMAVVLTVFGVLWGLDGPAVGVVNVALATGEHTALASWGFWYYARLAAVLSLSIQLILLLFPDGRLAPGRWRAVSIVALVLAAIMPLTYLCAPASVLAADDPVRAEHLARFDPGILTVPLPDGVWMLLLAVSFPASALSAALALAVVISRRRGATQERRAQLRWLTWAALVFVVMLLLSRLLPAVVADVAFGLGIAFVSLSIVIAVTRHNLYAIDRLLGWTIVYAILLVGVVLVDVGLYLVVGSLFDDRVMTLIAVLVVVAVYTPLRDRLHRLVSRWINGTRGDPYEVVSQLADRLESAGSSEEQLREIALSLARAFASAHVRVELDRADGTVLSAQTGADADGLIDLPLTYDGSEIGRILMQPGRRPAISARDRRLLGDIVRLAAAALRNADLSRELQLIREGLVAAREEERARLRRELHDGLGPLLGGIRLRLETARNLAERDPERALAVLDT
ncbi:histidine kinase, partial [Microbacterium sp.]|uniref:histidine kinase n=1 Tax=Microbacterium sp. TaxID=51671 RepID=UPI003C712930